MNTFWQELKRRNVFKVAVAYGVLSWFVLQVGSVLAPILGIEQSMLSYVIFVLVLGFPLAILFAWAFELTPEGLKRTDEVATDSSVAPKTGQRLNQIIIGVMALAIMVLVGDRFFLSDDPDQSSDKTTSDFVLGEKSYESIAVLPFVNMSDDAQQEFFSDGISEELLNLLAKTKGLRVAARTSSFAFKGQNQDIKKIGDQLDVETVLEGSVRKADTKLRITAQLIDVESGYHLWSDTYDRELSDIFKIQDEISAAIVGALQVHFGGEVQSASVSTEVNVVAYQHYLQGRDLLGQRTKEKIESAVEFFTKAIEADETYAAAYSGKADAYMLLSDSPGSYGDIPKQYAHELARPLVEKAMALDPLLADAHTSQGFLLYQSEDGEGALPHFDKALELRPSHPMALMWKALALQRLGRSDEALMALEEAHKVDPLSLVISVNLINRLVEVRRLEEASSIAMRMKEIAPDRIDRWGKSMRQLAAATGDLSLRYELSTQILEELGEEDMRVAQGYDLMQLGEKEKGIALLDDMNKLSAYANMGDCDKADAIAESIPQKERAAPDYMGARIGLAICKNDYGLALDWATKLETMLGMGDLFYFNGTPSDAPAPYGVILNERAGNQERAKEMRDRFDEMLDDYRGNDLTALAVIGEARLRILDGDLDGAIPFLERAEELHLLGLGDLLDPFLSQLVGRADFDAIMVRIVDHVNKERADLGWEPMGASASKE